MKQLRRLVGNLLCLLRALGQLFSYGLLYCWALLSPKAVLAARLVASESQLGEFYLRVVRNNSSGQLIGLSGQIRFCPGSVWLQRPRVPEAARVGLDLSFWTQGGSTHADARRSSTNFRPSALARATTSGLFAAAPTGPSSPSHTISTSPKSPIQEK